MAEIYSLILKEEPRYSRVHCSLHLRMDCFHAVAQIL